MGGRLVSNRGKEERNGSATKNSRVGEMGPKTGRGERGGKPT